ncbi:MAG: hypothetical protein ACK559_34095, partial [bacterium]
AGDGAVQRRPHPHRRWHGRERAGVPAAPPGGGVRYALPLIATLLMGCADDLVAIPGTTTRVTQPVSSIEAEPSISSTYSVPEPSVGRCGITVYS